MDIDQIALDPPPRQTAKRGKEVAQTILASPHTRATWEKVPQTILASPYNPGKRGKKCPKSSWQVFTTSPPYRQCLYGNNTFRHDICPKLYTQPDF